MKIRCWVSNRLIFPNNCECESVQFLSATYKVIGQNIANLGVHYKYLEVNHDDGYCNHKSQTKMKGDWRLAYLFDKYADSTKIGGIVEIPDDEVENELRAI